MSRNKENNPLFTAQQHGRLSSLGRHPPSEDFFTDSILEDSRIPTPSPQKSSPAKPRRAIGAGRVLQSTKDVGNKPRRSSLAEYTASRATKRLQPAPSLTRKKSPSPLRTDGPSTPLQSRYGTSLTSPTSECSSPPGGMTDVYRRIADEEDLVATEREVDTDEDELEDERQDTLELDVDVGDKPTDEADENKSLTQKRASRESTPVQSPSETGRENMVDDRVESYSEPPTLDFVRNEMTDRVLAAKLTPHVIDRAKDRARLDRLRQSRIPIDFEHSPKPPRSTPDRNGRRNDIASVASRGPIMFNNVTTVPKAYSDTSAESTPHKRIKAFSRATRAGAHKKTPVDDDDGSDTPPELREKERVIAFSKATRRKHKPDAEPESPEVAPGPRLVAFSRANGRSRPYGAPYEPNGSEQVTQDPSNGSVSSTVSEPLPESTTNAGKSLQAARSFLAKWRQETAEKRSAQKQESADDTGSQVDWAAAAADVPLPSVEESSTPRDTPPKGAWPSSVQKHSPADRIRKWENDFTGLSFQVSESPPVRTRLNHSDTLREKEIEELAKQAVTTNRLDEILVKDPNVRVRKSSSSLSPEDRRRSNPGALDTALENPITDGRQVGVGSHVPDTPVVVYKQSGGSREDSSSSYKSTAESQSSLDHLQRLARAASTTPKSSPPVQDLLREVEVESAIEDVAVPPVVRTTASPDQSPQPARKEVKHPTTYAVAETPRVTGAWTDTILPDTVKTQRRPQKSSKYLETPHVNAGAWIDTPLVNGNRAHTAPFPNIIEEVTEEITNGIVAGLAESVDEDGLLDEQPKNNQEDSEPQRPANGAVVIPPSALSNVLNEAKQKRLVSRDITDVRDDTLNLGDATIASFEELLTDAADITADLTSLIKTGAEDEVIKQRQREREAMGDSDTSEVAFIGHLTSRMERLMSNLHEARKGISRLEQRVSHSPPPDSQMESLQAQAAIASQGQDSNQPCSVCGRGRGRGGDEMHKHEFAYDSTKLGIPVSYSTFTVPVPHLFHPRRKDRGQILPRPTWLGWATIAVWIWYITECTLCEIYCHPLYAAQYVWPSQPEPEFPFVLPTMLWRWSRLDVLPLALGPGLLAPVWRLLVALYRVVGMFLGLTDGFVDDPARQAAGARAAAGKVAAEATKSVLNAAQGMNQGSGLPRSGEGPDLSMMNDEFI
ncbi:hypothetical protein A1O1_04757 [Capronia coronata CBS 617.96]|uniref:Uncharacterized protein n=1 Tax=Capronia coronata CBS 617.96 TaxID=1182541 RepID=W9YDV3_9EURO|nr:uncharacterized protein A1O1_04757 [Capronia coronata CBS 617.96]EXJ87830.1 hypothetical protein A1O1_04757 [Capronia coronata CBS 617.96]